MICMTVICACVTVSVHYKCYGHCLFWNEEFRDGASERVSPCCKGIYKCPNFSSNRQKDFSLKCQWVQRRLNRVLQKGIYIFGSEANVPLAICIEYRFTGAHYT